MRPQRILLITNPASRRGTRKHDITVAVMREAGVTVDAVVTTRPGEGAEIARGRAAAYDAVFTLGGDGTAMEVLGALAGTGCPIGVLPGGTGNQLARLLGIPLSTAAAAAALLAGDLTRIDLGRLGDGRRFAIACGAGLDAAMIERTPPRLKRGLGVSAYVLTAAATTLRHEEFDVRATIDGEVVERRAIGVLPGGHVAHPEHRREELALRSRRPPSSPGAGAEGTRHYVDRRGRLTFAV